MMKRKFTFLALLTGLCVSASGQPAGTLDVTFNGTGKVIYNRERTDVYWDVKTQADGKIVAVGTSLDATWASTIEVTRYLPDGSFDPSFGTGGHFNYSPNYETGAHKCFIREDGKILVAGYTTDYTNYSMVVIQLDANGNPDPAFGNNGVVLLDQSAGEEVLYAIAVQDDGRILVAGYAQNAEFKNTPVVIRLTESGALDPTFGINGMAGVDVTEIDNDFSALDIQQDGKIVAAGHISNGMSWFSVLAARFDPNGILDPAYGTGGIVNMNLNNVDDEIFDLELTENDEAVLAGFTVTQPDIYYHLLLMKLDINGQPVPAFGNNGIVTAGEVPFTFADALELQTDGRIVVSGCTGDAPPGNNDWALWRFNADGSPDAGFGTNGSVTTEFSGYADEALGLALYEDKIIVAGKARNTDNFLDFAVARYLNDVGVAVEEFPVASDWSVSPNPVRRGGSVGVTFEMSAKGSVTAELVGLNGTVVGNFDAGVRNTGTQNLEVAVPASFSAGVYFMRIRISGADVRTARLIVTE